MKKTSLFIGHCFVLCMLFVLLPGTAQQVFAQTGAFVTIWKTDNSGASEDHQITIPGEGTGYTIYWEEVGNSGNNNTITGTDAALVEFPHAGTYRVSISGGLPAFNRINFGASGDPLKLIGIEQWGNIVWSTMSSAFRGCSNMTSSATDAPDLSQVTSMYGMFNSCSSFNGAIGHWNTSQVTNMSLVFAGASSFNQPLNNWNTSQVTNMQHMFATAATFDQSLNNWNTSQVTNMRGMFGGATAFNQSLNNWNTSQVTSMYGMFRGAAAFNGAIGSWNTSQVINVQHMFDGATAFNQPIGNWNTSQVTNMSKMFLSASSFNQPLNNWDTGQVTAMSQMFDRAIAFNQPLGNWDTGQVTNMYSLFGHTDAFNQPLNNWDISQVTDIRYMFNHAIAFNQPLNNWDTGQVTLMSHVFNYAGAFNQSLNNWNTSQVTDMRAMFNRAVAFNQPLNSWNTSQVTNIDNMFNSASAFNQPLDNWDIGQVIYARDTFSDADAFDQSLGSWNITRVRDMSQMLSRCGMGMNSYDETLIGWATQNVQGQVNLGAVGLVYCKGTDARTSLINQHGWAIHGDTYSACPEINLQHEGVDVASGTTVNMGNVSIGGASAHQIFAIQNTGTEDLILSGNPIVQLQGIHPNDFTIVQTGLTSSVAPGNSQTFEVIFNPTQMGIRQASLVIYNNDSDENPYTIHLTGQGLGAPDIYLSQNNAEVSSGSTFNMGIAGTLYPSAAFEFIIENKGTGDLILQENGKYFVTIGGAHAQDFRVIKASRQNTLAPGQQAGFILQLFPSATGMRNATLTIQSNDPDEGTYVVHLVGNSVLDTETKLQVSPNPTVDQLTLQTKQWQGETINISIRNDQGLPVMTQSIGQAKDKINLDVSKYKAGWYIIVVNFKNTRLQYRFMKK